LIEKRAPVEETGTEESKDYLGVHGLHHVGVTVSDLDRSLRFYTGLGFILLHSPLLYSGKDLDMMVNVEGSELRTALLRAEDGTMIELVQYLEPKGREYHGRNCDTGSMHISFRVSDIDAIFAEMKNKVHFNSEPSTVQEGPLKGIKFVYFTDPDGIALEFFQESGESVSNRKNT
jgi:catechol 2,3-dioxygenase-like lactoylglutathione lyase family enzyme